MLPSHARVVIVGGGSVGCSLLYHLSKEGWADCVLIEKSELTSGSTWHAAGLTTHCIANEAIARMGGYSIDLFQKLEQETGQSVTWHGCGSLRLAYTDDELDYLLYILSVGRALDHPMDIIGPNEIRALHPFYKLDGVKAALSTPADGHVDPAGATAALAKGARQRGAKVIRHNRVLNIEAQPNGEWCVLTEQGAITCEFVVNAGGTFARQIGKWVGLDLPIVCSAHEYLITEAVPELAELTRELPILRDDHEISVYSRQEQGSVLMGIYRDPHPVWLEGTPWESENELFEADYDSIMPSLEVALERFPLVADKGIKQVVNGAITYVPDGSMLLGPAPGLKNFWCACGVPIGVGWGPGIGKYLAQWIVHGSAQINMRQFDPRRFGRWAGYDYAIEKVKEDYVIRHQVPFPGRDRPVGRPVRQSTLFERLRSSGAVFEQMFGWERPAWFARNGVPQRHFESFRRTPAVQMIEHETQVVREKVGLLDLSGFAKLEVSGVGAESFLDRLTTNHLPRNIGGVTLTYLLNDKGTIESELTCTRLTQERFYLLFSSFDEIRVLDWLHQHKAPGETVDISNVSDEFGVIAIAGPLSRSVLQAVTTAGLSNEHFPWFTAQEITVAGKRVRALRLSVVGELGWELHVLMTDLLAVYNALWQAGQADGIDNFGIAALTAMRLEKAIKGTRELNTTSNLREANMMAFVKLEKNRFVGRDAVQIQAEEDPLQTFVYLTVDVEDADCHGSEAVLVDSRLIGSITSCAYGPHLGQTLAFAYIDADYAAPGTELQVMALGKIRDARVLPAPAYDPENRRFHM